MTYYNTTNESGKDLGIFKNASRKQIDIIKEMIVKLNGKPFSVKDIYRAYPIMNTPVTSIRSRVHKLMQDEFIVETGNKVQGLFGRNEFEYIENNLKTDK